jgi:hypothetical protein
MHLDRRIGAANAQAQGRARSVGACPGAGANHKATNHDREFVRTRARAGAEKYVELTAPSAMVPVDEAWIPSTSLQAQKGKWKQALQMVQPPGQRAAALLAPAAPRGGGAGPSSYHGPGHCGYGGRGHDRGSGYGSGGRR